MISVNKNETLWVEKYRPMTIDDCILPPDTKKMLQGFIEKGDIPNLMLCGHQGMGKAQPLTSKLLTPTGYKLMRDVSVGDVLLDGEGKHTKVTGIFPQGIRPVYRITLQDDSTFEVSDEHINSVIEITDLSAKKYVLREDIQDKEEHIITTTLVERLKNGNRYAIKTVCCDYAPQRLNPKRDYVKIINQMLNANVMLSNNIMYGTLAYRLHTV